MDKDVKQQNYQAGSVDLSQFTERAITVPDSEEYYLVSAEKLEQLDQHRMSWAMEGLLASAGVLVASIVPAFSGLEKWTPTSIESFLSWLLLFASLVSALIFGVCCFRGRSKFKDIVETIRKGKRLVSQGGVIVEAAPKEIDHEKENP